MPQALLKSSEGSGKRLPKNARRHDRRKKTGVTVGVLLAISGSGEPLIVVPHCQEPLAARTLLALSEQHIGRDVVLMFENGNPEKPIIMGVLRDKNEQLKPRTAELDGDRLLFTANHEIVLRCGEASITLTRAGKVIIRGQYVLSRAAGMNRIKGGVVHIN
jgi:hypothetical protein